MKKIICSLLAMLMVFPLTGCTNKKKEIKAPVTFYYRTREIELGIDESVISSEQRESYGHTEDYIYITEMYLNGPTTGKCISPFPAGTKLDSLDFVQDKVLVVLSSHISLLSGAELSLACVCLSKTLLELTGKKSVQIRASGDLLDGKESITIAAKNFQLKDDTLTYMADAQ